MKFIYFYYIFRYIYYIDCKVSAKFTHTLEQHTKRTSVSAFGPGNSRRRLLDAINNFLGDHFRSWFMTRRASGREVLKTIEIIINA